MRVIVAIARIPQSVNQIAEIHDAFSIRAAVYAAMLAFSENEAHASMVHEIFTGIPENVTVEYLLQMFASSAMLLGVVVCHDDTTTLH